MVGLKSANRSIALVRFPDDSVMVGCFNKSTLHISYALIEPDDLLVTFKGNIMTWDDYMTYGLGAMLVGDRIKKSPESEFFDVDIYCDLNDGICWKGTASKEFKILSSGVALECVFVRDSGIPDWVKEFQKNYSEKNRNKDDLVDVISDYTLTKRESIEILIYNMINDIDPTGITAAKYRGRFAALSDSEFMEFVDSLVNP